MPKQDTSTQAPTLLAEARCTLRHGLLNHGLKLGEGIDRRGTQCAWLLDCREVLLRSSYLPLAGRLLWERVRAYQPQLVCGPSSAADLLLAALLYAAHAEGYALQGLMVRKERNAHGLRKLVEGPPIEPGARVVLLDDLLHSGRSIQRTIQALEPFRPDLVAVTVVVNYEDSGSAWLRAHGLPLEALFTLRELGIAPHSPEDVDLLCPRWTWSPLNISSYSASRSAPIVADDLIVVGSDQGFLLALGLDGVERWRFAVRDTERGILSTPVVREGKVYVGAYDGFVYCLELATGTLLWQRRVGRWIGSSPDLDPRTDLLYIGTEYGKNGGSLVALDAKTGVPAWEMQAGAYVHGSPTVDPGHDQVIVGSNAGTIHAVDMRTGEARWRVQTGGAVKAKPVLDGAGRCFAGSFDGFLYALDTGSGQLCWKRRLGRRLYTVPLICHQLVIAGTPSGHLVALAQDSGIVRWVSALGGAIVGGAAHAGEERVAVGSEDGSVTLLDARSGTQVQTYQTGEPIRTTPGTAPGCLVVPTCTGGLYAFSIESKTATH